MSTLDLVNDAAQRLEEARPALDLADAYLSARQPGALAFIAPEVRAKVGTRLNPVVVNWPRLTIGALAERLEVQGFRHGAEEDADAELWQIWRANGLDIDHGLAHSEAMAYGTSYVTVWAGRTPETPRIAVESARQVAMTYTAGTREATSAVKVWQEGGYGRATVFEPDRITRWRSQGKVVEQGYVPAQGWTLLETIRNPLGVVPVLELRNRQHLLGGGESELTDVIPLTDAIAKLASDLMVSAEFHAMPRRWATGIELPEDPSGEVDTSAAFSPEVGRTWFLEDPESKVGQFPEANLQGYVQGIELLTQQLASVTAIPAHYLNSLTGQLPSAESLRAAEASLVARVRAKMAGFGRAWADVARLALMVRDGREAGDVEVIWADPETRTVAQQADAALKKAELGVPWAQIMADLGYSPAQIERLRELRRQEALDGQGFDLRALGTDAA